MTPPQLDISLYEQVTLWTRIFNKAVRRAQERNHQHGLPNIFGRKGRIYYEFPDGRIVRKEDLTEEEQRQIWE